jgi:transcriptional regulator with XRE-family HTH domain
MDNVLSKRLKELRISNDLYQKDVAKKIGITESGYGYYEQGKRIPDSIMLNKLATLYKVTTDYLLGNTNIKNNTEQQTLDEELQQLLNDPDTLVAFKDFQNLTDTDKQEIINFIKFKKQQKK